MKYKIILNKSEEGYNISCAGLPGCWLQGSTERKAMENICDAIQEYLAAILESVRRQGVRETEIAG
ncbi:MAG: type II toxin-antitoxin system HicB family antitoxin [Candidatus Contendobacter sp.]|nr:MAG: type II toxin-antitoxin system HicB family antitoxin [Candidatus Contendobacter sp.]